MSFQSKNKSRKKFLGRSKAHQKINGLFFSLFSSNLPEIWNEDVQIVLFMLTNEPRGKQLYFLGMGEEKKEVFLLAWAAVLSSNRKIPLGPPLPQKCCGFFKSERILGRNSCSAVIIVGFSRERKRREEREKKRELHPLTATSKRNKRERKKE